MFQPFFPQTFYYRGLKLSISTLISQRILRRNVNTLSSDNQHDQKLSSEEFKTVNSPEKENKSLDNSEKQPKRPLVRRSRLVRGVQIPGSSSWRFHSYTISFGENSNEENEKTRNWTKSSIENRYLDDFAVPTKDSNNFTEKERIDDTFTDDSEENFSLHESPYERPSTITPTEKLAFHKIFKDIFENKQLSEIMSTYGEPFALKTDESDKWKTKKRTRELSDFILESSNFSSPEKLEEYQKKLKLYPSVLRKPAAEAFGLEKLIYGKETDVDDLSINHQNEVEQTPFGKTSILREQKRKREIEQNLEVVRENERDRVEKLMRAALTDFELWKVLEDEVFSLIRRLGLEDLPKVTGKFSSHRGRKKKRNKKLADSPTEETPVEQKEAPPPDSLAMQHNVSPLQLYGPLYPSYLLLGLRLLDRSFTRPSPLTMTLLPKIKSLGYISRVLGASTQFYNELLLIYRFRQNDFLGMLRLLEEMEISSLSMNQDTLDIIVDISKLQDRVRLGTQGLGMSMLWGLPNFARGKFSPWRDHLKEKLGINQQKGRYSRIGGRVGGANLNIRSKPMMSF